MTIAELIITIESQIETRELLIETVQGLAKEHNKDVWSMKCHRKLIKEVAALRRSLKELKGVINND